MGRFLKRSAERFLRYGGAAQVGRALHRGRSLVLAYHNILPAGHPPGRDTSLHLRQADFGRQLDLLQNLTDVVPLTDLLFSTAPGASRPRVAITFDDAYSGALTAGLIELRARSLPATVFVAPAFIGRGGFWWDEVVPRDPARPWRERALLEWQGKDAVVRERVLAEGGRLEAAGPACRCADEAALHEAFNYPGVMLGSHTWSHPNLSVLPEDELAQELSRPLTWLEQFGARALPVLSYPYGQFAAHVERAAGAAGYRAAFRVDGGWLPVAGQAMHALRRLNVPAGLSADGFALRLAGLFC